MIEWHKSLNIRNTNIAMISNCLCVVLQDISDDVSFFSKYNEWFELLEGVRRVI